MSTALVLLRRDLHLADHPALMTACAAHERVLPVYVHAPHEEAPWQPGEVGAQEMLDVFADDALADYARARDKRDYVWVFARTKRVSSADYAKLTAQVREMGYPASAVRKVPQHGPDSSDGLDARPNTNPTGAE